MKVPFLDLSKMDSELKNRLERKFKELLEHGVFSGGKEVESFESNVSEFLSSPYSISCANGTDALELALRALGIGPGDEVIVPALTWVSTAEVVSMVGATPVFWDTDQEGLLADDWVLAVTNRTKAIIPVHLYGKMVSMENLIIKAKEQGLLVIEDAAQAFGAFQSGIAAGTWGDVGCLSFYPTKNLGALGEAGMCLTKDQKIAEKIRLLRNHGQKKKDKHQIVGRNSRIDTLQAGFLNVFLQKFKIHQEKRKSLASIYYHNLRPIRDLKFPENIMEADHNAHLLVIQIEKRDELQRFLSGNGITTSIHYPEIIPDMQPYLAKGKFLNSRKLTQLGLSLPLNAFMTEKEVDFVVSKIQEFFQRG